MSAQSIGKTAFLGVAWPRDAKPTIPARLAAPWTKTGPKACRGRLFGLQVVKIAEAKRKFGFKMEIPAKPLNRRQRGLITEVNSERAWVVGGMIMRAFRWRRPAALGMVLATIVGIVPWVASAACPPGNRTLTFTNKCGKNVYLGQNLSSPH